MIQNYETIAAGTYVLMESAEQPAISWECRTASGTKKIAILSEDSANLTGFLEMDGSPSCNTMVAWLKQ